jgi:hypothetical protein
MPATTGARLRDEHSRQYCDPILSFRQVPSCRVGGPQYTERVRGGADLADGAQPLA